MIPGRPRGITYRQLAELDFGVFMCGGRHATCERGWGWQSHQQGRVDRYGTVHWVSTDRRANKRGMRTFMKLIGMAFHREWWTEPNWKRLYLQNVFATRKIQELYHYRVQAKWSYHDKLKAKGFLERQRVKNLRHKDRNVYIWLLRAGVHVVQSPSRRGVRK